jgi:hypothetical protein
MFYFNMEVAIQMYQNVTVGRDVEAMRRLLLVEAMEAIFSCAKKKQNQKHRI